MGEGIALAGKGVIGGVHDDPDSPPPAGPDAPKGWTWERASSSWKPKVRGEVLWAPDGPSYAPRHGTEPSDEAMPNPQSLRDPAPTWAQDDPEPKGKHHKQSIEDVPQEVQDDISGLGGLVATPILALARSIDPYCGAALADSFEDVMGATLPIICRSEKIVRYFTQDDNADWLMWGKLAMALAPVGKAIAEHHIFRTIEVVKDEKTGVVTVMRKTAGDDGKAHLVPPTQQEYTPDQYAA